MNNINNENKRSIRSNIIGLLYLLLMIPVGYALFIFAIFSSLATFGIFQPLGILWTFVLMPIIAFSIESILFKKGINLIIHGLPKKIKSR